MKNKILVITVIFTMLLCSTCFAARYTDERIANYNYNEISTNGLDFLSTCLNIGYDITGIDFDYYFLSYSSNDNFYVFLASTFPAYIDQNNYSGASDHIFYIKKSSTGYTCYYDVSSSSSSYLSYGYVGNQILYSSYDIYSSENNTGELVFQQTPLTILEAVEKTIIQTIPIMKTKIMETLGTLVPIAILVLSTLLGIYLIRLVISRAG